MGNSVVHWEIAGPDLAALRDFYAKAFDWTIDDAGEDYCLVRPAGDGLGGGLMQTRGEMPPYLTVYIAVEDLTAALNTIAGLGGTMQVPPTRINESMWFAMFEDPAGNMVGLLQGEPLDEQS
ncbi:VOC family protein [Actinoplanes sp. NPDC049802]|uniref:VOC family protein n=1 Tax=Actinoplanes sp. NPDC049802 TaxID=3154742 RepID=UPI00340A09FB